VTILIVGVTDLGGEVTVGLHGLCTGDLEFLTGLVDFKGWIFTGSRDLS